MTLAWHFNIHEDTIFEGKNVWLQKSIFSYVDESLYEIGYSVEDYVNIYQFFTKLSNVFSC